MGNVFELLQIQSIVNLQNLADDNFNTIVGAVIVVVAGSLSMLHDHVSAAKLSEP